MLYIHLHFLLFSIMCMIVLTKLRGRPCIRSLSRDREQATIVSELDSVGASLEGVKLLFRAYKLSKKYHVFAVLYVPHPALSSQETSVSRNLCLV